MADVSPLPLRVDMDASVALDRAAMTDADTEALAGPNGPAAAVVGALEAWVDAHPTYAVSFTVDGRVVGGASGVPSAP